MSQLKVMEWDAGSKMKGRRVREQKGGRKLWGLL